MSNDFTRRDLLKSSGIILGTGILAPQLVFADVSRPTPSSKAEPLVRLSLNENSYGPSPNVARAIQLELGRLSRYADEPLTRRLAEQIAEHEQIPVKQVVLGEILDRLGSFLGSSGGPGGEFLYSTPGYLALIDAAALYHDRFTVGESSCSKCPPGQSRGKPKNQSRARQGQVRAAAKP